MRAVGTVTRGVRAPIIKKGDDLVNIVADTLISAAKEEGFSLNDRDIVGVTEAVVARSQGNYATLEQISSDVRSKFPDGEIGLVFPILSRNRFSQILRGVAGGVDKMYIQLSYPADEVGNPLIDIDLLDEKGVDPFVDKFTEDEFRAIFGKVLHPFTGVDYIEYYKELCGGKAEIILANDARAILDYTKNIITADIHSRTRSKRRLLAAGAEKVIGLDEILNAPVDGSGYHPDYGLLGSNLATEDSVKLFPRDTQVFVDALSTRLQELTGKNIEVMVYGDGAFKDPIGGIWELADPVVSPAFTPGLTGRPNELKLKYIADNELDGLSSQDAGEAIKDLIKNKKMDMVNDMASQGTTPRRLTDLLGSLCDLTSGSGDKGTPIILIQGYFDSYAD
ncbi:MAG TPA: F420-0--gamma-glutamyl ligase [Coriobacteriia bacterium]|nr:F420-0--gamma-glutamyl ligase [Coriobacteriia bacterium]